MAKSKALDIKKWLAVGAAGALAWLCIHKKKSVDGVGLLSHLAAKYDSRASFYGKAVIDESNDGTILTLVSYNTPVATYDRTSGTLDVFGYYSATTARHIREFARQLGITLPSGTNIKGRYQN